MSASHPEMPHEAAARLRRQGLLPEAVAACRGALEREPGDARAWAELAHALRWMDRLDEAREAAQEAVRLDPGLAAGWFNLGAVHVEQGRADEGVAAYRKALEIEPRFAEAWSNLGGVLGAQGRTAEEIDAYRRALEANPQLAPVWSNLGNALRVTGELAEAAEACRRAAAIDPGFAPAWSNLGNALREQGAATDAIDAYEKALELEPEFAETWSNLGDVLQTAGVTERAIAAHRKAVELKPGAAELHFNFGVMLRRAGRAAEAAARYRRVLELDPDFVEALVNLGIIRAGEGGHDEALELYGRAVRLAPAHADARHNHALLCLARGDFEAGWASHWWRPLSLQAPAPARSPDMTLPGELRGRTLVLVGEQGIGDELFFLRCAPALKELGARLVCQCDRKLKGLLARTGLFEQVLVHGEAVPPAAATLLAGDLPLLLARAGRPAPAPALRLAPLEERVTAMRQKLARLGPAPYIGLTWRAGTPLAAQRRGDPVLYKEAPLDLLAGVLRGIPGTILVLQRNPQFGEIGKLGAALGREVADLAQANDDLEDMLALLAGVDEYIGVSNTNMHLMAGVGGSARVLVPHPAEFRWMAQGERSPWFPGFAIYRQARDGDWSAAAERLAADLRGSARLKKR